MKITSKIFPFKPKALLNWLPKLTLADQMDRLVDKCLALEPVSMLSPEKPAATLHRLEPSASVENTTPGRLRLTIKNLKKNSLEKNTRGRSSPNRKRGMFKLLKLALLAAILLALIPFLTAAVALYAGTNDTYQAYQHIRVGEAEKSRRLLNRAQALTAQAQSSYQATLSLLFPR